MRDPVTGEVHERSSYLDPDWSPPPDAPTLGTVLATLRTSSVWHAEVDFAVVAALLDTSGPFFRMTVQRHGPRALMHRIDELDSEAAGRDEALQRHVDDLTGRTQQGLRLYAIELPR